MSSILNLLPVLAFLVLMLGISVYVQKASADDRQKNFAKDYFIGGRSMGPWVTALAAQASDMSAWLLMGLP